MAPANNGPDDTHWSVRFDAYGPDDPTPWALFRTACGRTLRATQLSFHPSCPTCAAHQQAYYDATDPPTTGPTPPEAGENVKPQ